MLTFLTKNYGKITKIKFWYFDVFCVPEYVLLIYFSFKFRNFQVNRNFGYVLINFTVSFKLRLNSAFKYIFVYQISCWIQIFFSNWISFLRFWDIQILISDVSKIQYIPCLKFRYIKKKANSKKGLIAIVKNFF